MCAEALPQLHPQKISTNKEKQIVGVLSETSVFPCHGYSNS